MLPLRLKAVRLQVLPPEIRKRSNILDCAAE
jgi:hypothetical protein